MIYKANKESTQKDKFFFGGIIAASFAIILTLISQQNHSTAIIVSICGFAVGLPFLALMAIDVNYREISGKFIHHPFLALASALSLFGPYVGFVAAFWHVSFIAGIILAISIPLASICLLRIDTVVKSIDNPNSEI